MKKIVVVLMLFVFSKSFSIDTDLIVKRTKQLEFFKGSWDQKYFFTNGTDRPYSGDGMMECNLINKKYIAELDCHMILARDEFIRKIYIGYDVITDKYYVVFLDANSTAPFYGIGNYYSESKTYSFMGKYNEAENYTVELKVLFKIERDDKFIYSVTKIDGPKESVILEVGNFRVEEGKKDTPVVKNKKK